MLRQCLAALIALTSANPLAAQAVQPAPAVDFSTATAVSGSWSYQSIAGGSMARFVDSSGTARLVLQCNRGTRRVTIAYTSSAPAQTLHVWTSSASRNLAARFEPNAMRVAVELAAFDALLDGIAFSRGRIAVTMPGAVPLVAPAWPEAARTIEDCRN